MSPRNLIISIVAVVVVAAAAIVAIVVIGGDSKKTPESSPSSAAPTTPPTSTSAAPSASGSVSTTSCDDIANSSVLRGKLTLRSGGTRPSDVALPAQAPSLTCSGETHVNESAKVTALAWKNVRLSDYVSQLTGSGWTDNRATPPFHVLDKKGAKYEIVAFTVNGNLVAIFGHS